MSDHGTGTSTGTGNNDENGTREDVHEASSDDRLQGVLSQVSADVSLNPELDARASLRDRLTDQGIQLDDAALDQLVASIPSSAADEPGPFIQNPD